MMEAIRSIGLLPLLDSGIRGFSADELVDPECRYVMTDDGWKWPLWEWKGPWSPKVISHTASFLVARRDFSKLID